MTNLTLLDDDDLAIICKVKPSTIKGWRRAGTGPRVTWLGHNSPRYTQEDVDRWLAERAAS